MTSAARRIVAVFAFASLSAGALELEERKLYINGFGSWGYGAANNGNTYALAQPGGSFAFSEFAIGVNARLSERALAGAEVRFSSDEGTVIDWAFCEWRFSDRALLRLGVVKHAFGLFGDVPHVGTLRPFFLLPSGIYGPSEVTGAGVRGFSIGGALPSETGGRTMQLDVHVPRFTWPGGPEAIGPTFASLAQTAESIGVRTLSVMDHWFQMDWAWAAEEPMLEGYTALSFAAAKTQRLRLRLIVGGVTYRNPGLIEKPMGATIREIVYDYGGGTASGKRVRAVQVGGPLGAYFPE
jgi:hypothetical protein